MTRQSNEAIERRDLSILTLLRKTFNSSGRWRTAGEFAELSGYSDGLIRGAFGRLLIEGDINRRTGKRPRHSSRDGSLVCQGAVNEYAPSHENLRITIRVLEVCCQLSGLDATVELSTEALTTPIAGIAAREVDGAAYSRSGEGGDWGSVKFEVVYRGSGFLCLSREPGHRIEIDPFLEGGAN